MEGSEREFRGLAFSISLKALEQLFTQVAKSNKGHMSK